MRTINKFRFRIDRKTDEFSSYVDIIWLAPSGAEFIVGAKNSYQTDRWVGKRIESTDGLIFTTCMSTLKDHLFGLKRGLERRSFIQCCMSLTAPYQRYTGVRHNMTIDECTELGALVRQCVNDGNVDLVIDFLNDNNVRKSIIDALPDCLSGIQYGQCGHFHNDGDDYRLNGGGTICGNCADDDDQYRQPENSSLYYCSNDLYWHEGPDCWRTYEQRDDDDDEDDSEDNDDTGMHNYSADVTQMLHGPKFHSSATGAFTIGVELEVEARRGERSELVDTILAQVGTKVICKHDGSLTDGRGVELVSVPQEYSEAVALFAGLDFPTGTRAWDGGHCGLHVHVDGRAFTRLSIAKFLAFWNHSENAKLIRRVAGRHPTYDAQAQDYASLSNAGTHANVVKAAKHHEHGASRYRLVNTLNLKPSTAEHLGLARTEDRAGRYNTVEIRIFRASLRKERMLAQIEMAAASVYFARDTSLQAVLAKDFELWLTRNVAQFPHLASFLKLTRKLVPDPKAKVVEDEPADAEARNDQLMADNDVIAADFDL